MDPFEPLRKRLRDPGVKVRKPLRDKGGRIALPETAKERRARIKRGAQTSMLTKGPGRSSS